MKQPIHPGRWLKERKAFQDVGAIAKVSKKIGYTYSGLSKVIHEQRSMSMELALKLERHLKYSATNLVMMQTRLDVFNARNDYNGKMEEI